MILNDEQATGGSGGGHCTLPHGHSGPCHPVDARDAEIADLKRQLADRDAVIVIASEHVKELRDAWQRGCIMETDGKGGTRSNRNADVDLLLARSDRRALDAYVQEKVDRERREVSDWIDAYAKSEGLEITLETKTTEERIRALCTLLSAKAAHEKDRAVLAESEWWAELDDRATNWALEASERLAANRDKVKP